MQNADTIRKWQLQILENNIAVLTHVVNNAAPADLLGKRDGADGWTGHQVIGHMRDFESVFIQRATVTLEQDNPPLPFPNPDQLAIDMDYHQTPVAVLLAEWVANRRILLDLYAGVAGDQWERPAQHPTRGNLPLNDQLFLAVWHDTNHLAQLAKILAS